MIWAKQPKEEESGVRRFLTKLAQENPERFEREWAKRIESWADEIWVTAKDGKIDDPLSSAL